MKSTRKLMDNLMNNEYRKCRIDLDHAQKTIVDRRIQEKKKEYLDKLNGK